MRNRTERERENNRIAARRFAQENPERVAETKRRYTERHADRVAASKRKWRENNPVEHITAQRASHIKHKYGISVNEYEAMLEKQGHGCAICGGVTANRFFSVDHDHDTNEVRGLLCQRCNAGLGYFERDMAWLHKALTYLGTIKNAAVHTPAQLVRSSESPSANDR